MTERTRDPELESFFALLTARRAPQTVDAYRRDLARLGEFLGAPVATASAEDIERYVARLRDDGLSASTIARRTAAARTFFRHQLLMGTRTDNPAAAVELPRRTRKLPKTLSPGEVERLIDAANGVTPRALRDRALVELLYGAGLRVSEAMGIERGGVDPTAGGADLQAGRRREGRRPERRTDRPRRVYLWVADGQRTAFAR